MRSGTKSYIAQGFANHKELYTAGFTACVSRTLFGKMDIQTQPHTKGPTAMYDATTATHTDLTSLDESLGWRDRLIAAWKCQARNRAGKKCKRFDASHQETHRFV
jgi:hypothetical protein